MRTRLWVGLLLAGTLAMLGLTPGIGYADWIRTGEWQLSTLHARPAWRLSTGAGVIVAVLDSGVDAQHSDLVGQVLPGADFVDGSTDGRTDFVGHGTTVAALIAGHNNDDDGIAGIAPKAKILPVRVLDKQNKYDDSTTVANGLRWAVDHGAKVVNMSLGGSARSTVLSNAIAYAYAHDVVVVACTGNVTGGDPNTIWYPAREPGVLAVAGLTQADSSAAASSNSAPGGTSTSGGNSASGSSGSSKPNSGGTTSGKGNAVALWSGGLTGPDTVLTAPAVNMLGAKPGGYWRVQGTSFAAPLVAATAALIRAKWPTMSAANVINRLVRTARDLGPAGRDPQFGYGEVDALRALTASVPSVSRNPLLPPIGAVQPEPSATGQVSGRGGPAPEATNLDGAGAPGALAALDPADTRRRVAWGIVAGGTVFASSLGAGLILLRRRRQHPRDPSTPA